MNMVELGMPLGGLLIALVAVVRGYPFVRRFRVGARNELNGGQVEALAPARSSI